MGGHGRMGVGKGRGCGREGDMEGMVVHIGAYFSPLLMSCRCDTQGLGRLHRQAAQWESSPFEVSLLLAAGLH